MHWSTTFALPELPDAVTLLLAMLGLIALPAVVAGATVPPEMTAARARRILLPFLQPPDNTLTRTPEVEQWRGHSYFQFYGANGKGSGAEGNGYYRIDAATGEIRIDYNRPASPGDPMRLPPNEQLSRAQDFVRTHFRGFSPDTFAINDVGYDEDNREYEVIYVLRTPLLIDVPRYIDITLDAAVGYVKQYRALDLPLAVSPVPSISTDQAVELARQWMADNISADAAYARLMPPADLGTDPVTLKVVVGFLLDQELRYEISFAQMVIYVDAHSGAITGTDGYAGGGGRGVPAPPRLAPREREEIVRLVRAGTNADFNKPVVERGGDAYIWSKYLAANGISVKVSHGDVMLRNRSGQHSVLRQSAAEGASAGLLVRRDGIYVSLRAARALGAPFDDADRQWEYVPQAAARALRPKANGQRPVATHGAR